VDAVRVLISVVDCGPSDGHVSVARLGPGGARKDRSELGGALLKLKAVARPSHADRLGSTT
jgi:hypothetical protein